jgi:parallel beta-helix repeat protein
LRVLYRSQFRSDEGSIPTNRRGVLALLAGATLGATKARSAAASGAVACARSAGEIRAAVVPSDYSFECGDVRRYGMSVNASPAENTAALQRCLNANAGSTTVVSAADGDYRLSGRISAPSKTSIALGRGARLRWTSTEPTGTAFLGSPTRPGIEVLGDDFRLYGAGELVGPSQGAYVVNEIGVLCIGASAIAPRSGISISDEVELSNWGSRAITMQFATGIRISGIKIRNCGYGGMQFLSCSLGQIQSNTVGDIGPGASGNAYGISCSHDSRNYGADPNATVNGRRVAHPFCSDFDVGFNVVHDIPLWVGIDFHGAYECRAHDNKVYNCRHGILIQGSSGMAVDFAGEHNSIIGNSITTQRMNGEPTTISEVTRLGISINGGKVVPHRSISVRENVIDGYGDSKNTSFSLQHTYTTDVDISNNRITNWSGYGCYSAHSQGVIRGNDFGPVADSRSSACIMVAIDGRLDIIGNRHAVEAGRAAMYGLVINSPTDAPYLIQNNDFRSATVQQYAGHSGVRLSPSQIQGGAP